MGDFIYSYIKAYLLFIAKGVVVYHEVMTHKRRELSNVMSTSKAKVFEKETLELSWMGLEPTTTRFLGQCSTN